MYRPASGPGRSGSRGRDSAPDGTGLGEIRASAICAYWPATEKSPRAGRPVDRIPQVARNTRITRYGRESAGTRKITENARNGPAYPLTDPATAARISWRWVPANTITRGRLAIVTAAPKIV